MTEQQTNKSDNKSALTVDETYKLALDNFNSENYSKSDILCTSILNVVPDFILAINLIGLIAQKINRHDLALKQFERAIEINGNLAWLYYNLGISLYSLGRIDETIKIQEKATTIDPNYADAYRSLGIALAKKGKLDKSVLCLQKTISLKPDYAEAYSNLAATLIDQGKLDDAVINCKKAISLQPDFAEAYSNLGASLIGQGKLDEAVANCKKAVSLQPDNALAYCNLGTALKEKGNINEAFTSFQKAVSINPHTGLNWAGYTQCINYIDIKHCSEEFSNELIMMLLQPSVSPRNYSSAVIKALYHNDKFSAAIEICKSGQINNQIDYLTELLSSIPLFLRLMELTIIADLNVEQMLTQIRDTLLDEVINGNNEVKGIEFYVSLAIHCFINEYLYSKSKKEQHNIVLLQEQIELCLKNRENILLKTIIVLAMYKPLHSFSWSDQLLESTWSQQIDKLIEYQVVEPIKEQVLRTQVPSFGSITDTISKSVQSQYEENPYPRWIKTGLCDKPKTIEQTLQITNIQWNSNGEKFSANPDILIAGCGTGQHSLITASNYLNSNVLAIDLSLSSLSYAIRKTREFGVSNVEYFHGDILQIEKLEKKFDLIESVGVLHHMDDPIAGWQELVNALKPNGLMKIGLYSKTARQAVTEARKIIAKKRYKAKPDDLRRCRSEIIKSSHNSHSKIGKILNHLDFYCLSECRDLLFHVQEHQFTIPQIELLIQKTGLKFLGFEILDSQIMSNYRKFNSKKEALSSLSIWNEFELQHPDTFVGMYIFWVQKV
ncbi:MAG: tetratricopeptide repeat protein [Magnetococcales bacterium]|nr:tetratricopeptide repeat protein [Magnetococcales bacterium]